MEVSPVPLCNFLCTPLDPNQIQAITDVCVKTCEEVKDCGLTPSMLYAFVEGILQDAPLLNVGVAEIIRDRVSSLAFRVAIYQQMPWILTFSLLVIGLAIGRSISFIAAGALIIIGIILIAVFVWWQLTDIQNIILDATQNVFAQIRADVDTFRSRFAQDAAIPLYEAISESRSVCTPLCREYAPIVGTFQQTIDQFQSNVLARGGTFNQATQRFVLNLPAINILGVEGYYRQAVDDQTGLPSVQITIDGPFSQENCTALVEQVTTPPLIPIASCNFAFTSPGSSPQQTIQGMVTRIQNAGGTVNMTNRTFTLPAGNGRPTVSGSYIVGDAQVAPIVSVSVQQNITQSQCILVQSVISTVSCTTTVTITGNVNDAIARLQAQLVQAGGTIDTTTQTFTTPAIFTFPATRGRYLISGQNVTINIYTPIPQALCTNLIALLNNFIG